VRKANRFQTDPSRPSIARPVLVREAVNGNDCQ